MIKRGFIIHFLAVLATAMLVADVQLVVGVNDYSEFTEMIMLNVMCDQATASISLTIISNNYSLVHFPTGVNMFDSHLEEAVEIMVGRTPTLIGDSYSTFLIYGFDNLSSEEARAAADAMTPSMGTAFGVSFSWEATNASDTEVVVSYIAIGSVGLDDFAEHLESNCFAEDVDGFCEVISLMHPVFTIGITAYKDVGSFEWMTSVTAAIMGTSISTGSDSHTIDVLDLLGASSLAPSPYGYDDDVGAYVSQVMLTITSSSSLLFVSCQPPLASLPNERGWTDSALPTLIMTQFSFGSNATPVTELTYTFSGTVIPEFVSGILPLFLMIVFGTLAVFVSRKQLQKS